MKRRGFLGLLGGAAVAGPGMVKQAAASGIEAMALPGIPMNLADPPDYGGTSGLMPGDVYDHGKYLREELAKLVGISDEDRREQIASQYISALDPDLAVNRSFSLAYKVQEQKRRNFEAWRARRHRSLTRQLADYLKNQVA